MSNLRTFGDLLASAYDDASIVSGDDLLLALMHAIAGIDVPTPEPTPTPEPEPSNVLAGAIWRAPSASLLTIVADGDSLTLTPTGDVTGQRQVYTVLGALAGGTYRLSYDAPPGVTAYLHEHEGSYANLGINAGGPGVYEVAPATNARLRFMVEASSETIISGLRLQEEAPNE